MARPYKYADDTDKPVSVSLRIPRDLYDQAQHLAQMRRTSLTALVLEGLRLRLETPLDPRDMLVSHDDTVMQDLQELIDTRIQQALQAFSAMASIPSAQPTPAFSHDKNTVMQKPQTPAKPAPPLPHDDNITVTQSQGYDASKYYLGRLCPYGHDYEGTGRSLLYLRNRRCLECDKQSAQTRRKAKAST
jgi:hypothetical protein